MQNSIQQDICDMFFSQIVYNVALMEFLLLGSIPHGESIFSFYKEPIILQDKPTKLGCCKIIGMLVLLGLQEVQDRTTWTP